MAGQGLDRIPLRIPERWDASWFETFVRDVLAQADVRNAVEGGGIAISGTSDEPATLAASPDVLALLAASLLTITASALPNARQLIAEPDVLEIDDNGAGDTAVLSIVTHGLPLSKLATVEPYSVLGDAFGITAVMEITATANDTLLGRRSDVLGFGQLTLPMIPDELITFAKLQDADALSVLGRSSNTAGVLDELVAGTDHHVLRRSGAAVAFGSLDLSQAGTVGSSRLALANIVQITGQAVLGVASAGSGNLAAISAGTNDRVLAQTAGALSFVQLTAGMFPNTVVPDAALSANVPLLNAANTFTATQLITVADEAVALRMRGATGGMRLRPYVASGTRAIIEAVNIAEDAYINFSIFAGALLELSATAITLNGVAASDFARLSQNNVFLNASSGSVQSIQGEGQAALNLFDTSGTNGARRVSILVDDNNHFYIQSLTDAGSSTENLIDATLNGSSQWTSLAVSADSITLNAALVTIATGGAERLRLIAADAVGDNYITFYEADGTTKKADFGFRDAGTDIFYLISNESGAIAIGSGGSAGVQVNNDTSVVLGQGATPEHTLNTVTATTASAGAQTLPSNPVGFWRVTINGTSRRIPYYAA